MLCAHMNREEPLTTSDLERLRELRAGFLRAEEGAGENEAYWSGQRDLELYELTFAQRIGWKWDAVLSELERRGALPSGAVVCDWACGTGIAVRRFAATSAGAALERVYLGDRSKQATWFARDALLAERSGFEVVLHPPQEEDPDVLLVSHVLDELDELGLETLRALIRRSKAVIWVEAGAKRTSRALGAERSALLESFEVVAPCTHAAACGALAREDDWCHFFAKAPVEVFTSAFWRRFGDELGLDLRSLPYSFLALRARGAPAVPRFDGAARLLGRVRPLKGRALLDLCDERGVRELSFLERTDKQLFKRLQRSQGEAFVFDVAEEAGRIRELRPRLP